MNGVITKDLAAPPLCLVTYLKPITHLCLTHKDIQRERDRNEAGRVSQLSLHQYARSAIGCTAIGGGKGLNLQIQPVEF